MRNCGSKLAFHFYPRPPRGGRPVAAIVSTPAHQFLSTPSARRATVGVIIPQIVQKISIHALREEGDLRTEPYRMGRLQISIHALREEGDAVDNPVFSDSAHFYPRPPRGGRHRQVKIKMCDGVFLSTPSARRATVSRQGRKLKNEHFYPRPPRGGRLPSMAIMLPFWKFLSTPSARRATA